MRERISYICEICGAEYSDKNKCELCENCHKRPVEIVRVMHRGVGSKYMGYPFKIDIKMSDGSVMSYKPSLEEL